MPDETDEILIMAYVDGELPPDQRADVERRLAGSDELRALEREMRDSRELLAQAFAAEADRPVPESLHQMIAGADIEDRDPAESNVVTLADFMKRPAFREVRRVAAAAACLLLAVGLGFGGFVGPLLDDSAGGPIASADLLAAADPNAHAVLNQTASGEIVAWHSAEGRASGRIVPIATFQSEAGQYCRQFTQEVTGSDGSTRLLAIACRTGTGTWSTTFAMVAGGPGSQNSGTYVTASGPTEEAFAKAAAAIGTAPALDPAAERILLDQWSGK